MINMVINRQYELISKEDLSEETVKKAGKELNV